MSMQYIRDTYGVPAKRGRLVEVYSSNGRLAFRGHVASASNYIHVKSERGGHSLAFHPTQNVVYYDDDGQTVLLDTRHRADEEQKSRMQYIRDSYGVPAFHGRLVEVYLPNGHRTFRGRIISATWHSIRVRSESGRDERDFAPDWHVVYYDDGQTVLLDTRLAETRQRLTEERADAMRRAVRVARRSAIADHRAAEEQAFGKPVGWESKRASDERWIAVGAGSARGKLAARSFAGVGGEIRPVYAGAPEPVTS